MVRRSNILYFLILIRACVYSSSCARRSLPCNYNHSAPTTSLAKKKALRASAENSGPTASPPSPSPPASSHGAFLGQAPVGVADGPTHRDGKPQEGSELDLKRKNDELEPIQQHKRPRTEGSPASDSAFLDSPPHGL
jgi:hypothetical protein